MTLTSTRRAFVCALFISITGILALGSVALAQPVDAPTKSLPDLLGPWFGLAAVVISIGGTIYAWLQSRSKNNAEHLKVHDEKLVDHASRIQAIEGELKHLPAKDDVNDLKLALAQLGGTVGRLDESLNGVSRTIRRVEDYLMKEPKH